MRYIKIDAQYAADIANLTLCLIQEIIDHTATQHFEVNESQTIERCKDLMSKGIYQVVAAFDNNTIVGFGSLCESHSLYAEGAFGILQEFYVMPHYRSQAVGKTLLETIIQHAKKNGWKRLELCTPPLPEFDRTVAFYQANGFEITGGHKMKLLL